MKPAVEGNLWRGCMFAALIEGPVIGALVALWWAWQQY